MGFYFRKVNTEDIVCVLNAEANPVKEQKHYNGIGPCNGSQSKKTSNKTVLGSYITIIEVGYSAFFVSLNFRLFVGCLTFSCCLRLSFVVSDCRLLSLLSTTSDNISIDTQYFKLYYLCCRKFEHAFGLSIQV